MSVDMKPLQELIKELSEGAQAEVRDFAEFLLMKQKRGPGRPLRQDWAGALREQRDQYTALDLQRKALDWRDD